MLFMLTFPKAFKILASYLVLTSPRVLDHHVCNYATGSGPMVGPEVNIFDDVMGYFIYMF